MFESSESLGSFEQLCLEQRRSQIIRSYLFHKETKEKADKVYSSIASQIDIASLEALQASIKLSNYQEPLMYPNIRLHESVFCEYNPVRQAQFLCCHQKCNKHAVICGDRICKCFSDHQRCIFISIQSFIDRIAGKLLQPIPKQIKLYFQAKLIIYDYMANRISQERQSLKDFQQDITIPSEKSLYVYQLDQEQPVICQAPKVQYGQKISQDHQKCTCFPYKINKNTLQQNQIQAIQTVCSKIQDKYSSLITYLDQKIEKLQQHKKCANLNSAQFFFFNFLKSRHDFFAKGFKCELFDFNKTLKYMEIVPGSVICLARKQREKHQNIDFNIFAVYRVRKIWKSYCQNFFRKFVQVKTMNQLFCRMKKTGNLQIYSVQQLIKNIDTVLQGLNQGEKNLFSNSLLKKTKYFRNLEPLQLKIRLKKCKDKYDKVSISNDIFPTAINQIETIKQLGKFKNVTKLEIKWCWQMKGQVAMEILKSMPRLKYLALLGSYKKLSSNFLNKLSQLKQLKYFYSNFYGVPEHYKSYYEDFCFFTFNSLNDGYSLASIEEIVELSKLSKLVNIEINDVKDSNGGKIIKNIKMLKHLTLGYSCMTNDNVNFNLFKEVYELRTLRVLSIIGINVSSKQVDHIIINNPHLKAIIIKKDIQNYSINDRTIQLMTDLIQLQTLCISMNKAITGRYLNKLDRLIILEMDNCDQVSQNQIKEALGKMHKLQYLKLNYNSWVDDQVIMSIQSCKQLTFLSIHCTSISSEGLKHLRALNRLDILICGCNKINGSNLIELAMHSLKITRLSVQGLNISNNDLLKISQKFQAITHLDIRDTNITEEGLLKFKQLKLVNKPVEGYSYDF